MPPGLSFVFGVPTAGRSGGVHVPDDRLKNLKLVEFTSATVVMCLLESFFFVTGGESPCPTVVVVMPEGTIICGPKVQNIFP